MPILSKAALFRVVQVLNRFVPVIARGLGLGFAIVAIATLAFGMGEYADSSERYVYSGIFALLALVAFGISRAVKPALKWILRRI